MCSLTTGYNIIVTILLLAREIFFSQKNLTKIFTTLAIPNRHQVVTIVHF